MTKKNRRTHFFGFSHPRCYAREDKDCSTKISLEHFISKNLLDRIDANSDRSVIAGLAWQEPETFNSVPTKGLAANVLCESHNSRLADLDALIGKFADGVKDTDHGRFAPGKPFRASGSGIERWMLKCLLGMTNSNNITSRLKPECLELLFGRTVWPEGWGLYFDTKTRAIHHTDAIRIETLVGPDKLILAAKFFIQGLPLTLALGKPDNREAFGIWRPAKIVFAGTAAATERCCFGGIVSTVGERSR